MAVTAADHSNPTAVFTTDVEGLKICYHRAGAGPALVLLHGFTVGSSLLTYGPVFAPLSEHFDVIIPDLPGYGSSASPKVPFATSDYAHFVVAFLDALGLAQVNLAGFSKGGAIALTVALQQPEKLHKLMLISSYALNRYTHIPVIGSLALHTPWLVPGFWFLLRQQPRLLPLLLKLFIFANRPAVTQELLSEIRTPLARPGHEKTFIQWLRRELGPTRYRTEYSRVLTTLEVPTLLLHGKRDIVVPIQGAIRAARDMPNGALVKVPNCGHWLPREKPEVLLDNVLSFFEG